MIWANSNDANDEIRKSEIITSLKSFRLTTQKKIFGVKYFPHNITPGAAYINYNNFLPSLSFSLQA